MFNEKETASGAEGAPTDEAALAQQAEAQQARIKDAEKEAQRVKDKAEKAAADAIALEAMAPLSKAQIIGVDDMPTKWVPVPQWGGKVLVRALSGTERDYFEAAIVTMRGKSRVTNTENIRAKLCQLTIVDPTDAEKRRPMFTRKEIDALGKKSAAALDLIYTEAAQLSGLSNEDVEELAGNSAAGSGASSSS